MQVQAQRSRALLAAGSQLLRYRWRIWRLAAQSCQHLLLAQTIGVGGSSRAMLASKDIACPGLQQLGTEGKLQLGELLALRQG